MLTFNSNDFIDVILYDKNKIKSYIKYRKLLYKIKRISPDYKTLEVIYEFMDQLNYAYFYCLDDDNHLFIGNSRDKKKDKNNNKSLVYKDSSVTISFILKSDSFIELNIKRYMGYKETVFTFKDGGAGLYINNKLEEQLFINCTNLLMDELYKTIKKYRRFRRLK